MEILSFDKYLSFSKEEAYNLFLNEKNIKILKVVVYIAIFFAAVVLIVQLSKQGKDYFDLILNVITFLGLLYLILFYKKFINLKNVRRVSYILFLIIFGLGLAGAIIDIHSKSGISSNEKKELIRFGGDEENKREIVISTSAGNKFDIVLLFIILVPVFKFTRNEILQLCGIAIFLPLTIYAIILNDISLSRDVPELVISGVVVAWGVWVEKKRRFKFYDQYNIYRNRNFESMRMKKELDSARQIQLSMLPENFTRINDLEISGISHPASEVGGDYFDYFKISENEVAIFICDVSGHGVASGLMLAGLRSGIHLILEDTSEPVVVIDKLNRMMRKIQSRKMFVTAIFAVIDFQNNRCRMFNAGHLPPYKISGNTGEIFKIKKHGITLGAVDRIINGTDNHEVEIEFHKNDKILFYTDGVNEAMDHAREEYGFSNIEKVLMNNTHKNPSELLDLLYKDIKSFIKETAQRDDLTILSVGRIQQ